MAYPCSPILFALLMMMEVMLISGHTSSHYVDSRASYYKSPDGLGTSSGKCGYAEYGIDMNAGDVAAASQLLYRNGAGCGACYQVRCKDTVLCSGSGVKLVVTDYGEGDKTDFKMSPHAFTSMAKKGKDDTLRALGVVDVEYRRVACNYPGYNIWFKINKNSNYPSYLSLLLLYQGGERDVVAVEVSQEGTSDWKEMWRRDGCVWDIVVSSPKRNLALRFQLSGGEWIYAPNTIPSSWKAGFVYDSGIQLEY